MPEISPAVLLTFGIFLLLIILRLTLDLNIAVKLVKFLHFLPVRNYFRDKPPSVHGDWEQSWESDSERFPQNTDRHSNCELKQFCSYVYGEFTSKQRRYCLFGQIQRGFIFGRWFDAKDELGYFGTFELRIVDSNELKGRWIGHSNRSHEINHGCWSWSRTS